MNSRVNNPCWMNSRVNNPCWMNSRINNPYWMNSSINKPCWMNSRGNKPYWMNSSINKPRWTNSRVNKPPKVGRIDRIITDFRQLICVQCMSLFISMNGCLFCLVRCWMTSRVNKPPYLSGSTDRIYRLFDGILLKWSVYSAGAQVHFHECCPSCMLLVGLSFKSSCCGETNIIFQILLVCSWSITSLDDDSGIRRRSPVHFP